VGQVCQRGSLKLFEDMKRRLPELTRSQYAVRALDWIFERPIFSSSDFISESGIPAATGRRFLGVLQDAKILKAVVQSAGQHAAVFAFSELLKIAEGQEFF
jgi:hypothetical protein